MKIEDRMNEDYTAGETGSACPSEPQGSSASSGFPTRCAGGDSSMNNGKNLGWRMQWRCIWDNPHSNDPEWGWIWMYLLDHATHKPMDVMWNGKRITLQPGQLITGRHKIAEKTGVLESKVKRVLMLLKSEQQIGQQTSNVSSLITITNWSEYQSSGQQNGQPVDSKRTADGQPVDTNKNRITEECKEGERETPAPEFAEAPSWTEFWEYCQRIGYAGEWHAKEKWLWAENEGWNKAARMGWRKYAQKVKGWWNNDGCPMHPTRNGKPILRSSDPNI